MKTILDSNLFWFIKPGTQLDLNVPYSRDMFVQQVITTGKVNDIKNLIQLIKLDVLEESFKRIKRYLPKNVRYFWEDAFGNYK